MVLAVAVDDGDSAGRVVKETEGDAFAVGAELGTVDVVVTVFGVGDEYIDGVLGCVIVKILREGNLAQHESGARVFAPCEGDRGPLLVNRGVDGIGEVGERNLVLVRIADDDIEMGVSLPVAVLVADVGEDGTAEAIFVNIDAFIEPGLLRLETGLRVFRDVYDAGVFDGNFPDLYAINNFGSIFRLSSFVFRLVKRHLENSPVKPIPAKVRNTVNIFACNNREVLPESVLRELCAFDERAKRIFLGLVLFRDLLFPGVVKFLFADAENFFDRGVKCDPVDSRHFRPDFRYGRFSIVLADVAD